MPLSHGLQQSSDESDLSDNFSSNLSSLRLSSLESESPYEEDLWWTMPEQELDEKNDSDYDDDEDADFDKDFDEINEDAILEGELMHKSDKETPKDSQNAELISLSSIDATRQAKEMPSNSDFDSQIVIMDILDCYSEITDIKRETEQVGSPLASNSCNMTSSVELANSGLETSHFDHSIQDLSENVISGLLDCYMDENDNSAFPDTNQCTLSSNASMMSRKDIAKSDSGYDEDENDDKENRSLSVGHDFTIYSDHPDDIIHMNVDTASSLANPTTRSISFSITSLPPLDKKATSSHRSQAVLSHDAPAMDVHADLSDLLRDSTNSDKRQVSARGSPGVISTTGIFREANEESHALSIAKTRSRQPESEMDDQQRQVVAYRQQSHESVYLDSVSVMNQVQQVLSPRSFVEKSPLKETDLSSCKAPKDALDHIRNVMTKRSYGALLQFKLNINKISSYGSVLSGSPSRHKISSSTKFYQRSDPEIVKLLALNGDRYNLEHQLQNACDRSPRTAGNEMTLRKFTIGVLQVVLALIITIFL